ncbi:hypothetical protein A6R68_17088 [Neotoma lepida]|uniref:Coiled-coil domain-containing protein 6 n=1 Tax=Neotoma lepida TaxID=56216 RepID=A0A1A6HDW5_NEOLE|nr:hypothetical protein A6R68_17088 [Neotoma lepida]
MCRQKALDQVDKCYARGDLLSFEQIQAEGGWHASQGYAAACGMQVVSVCNCHTTAEQARAEQEEEFISNTLFKKIQALQKEKETLAVNYEKEEEFLTNELSRKLMQLQHEKAELEQHLEQEQEFQVNKLMKKIKKLENDTISKQLTLEQLRREKIDLENTLEQEQEALVNRLWKRMDKLEAEKRILQEKLDQPVSAPPSPRDISMEIDSPENMMRHIRFLKNEVERLKKQLRAAQLQHSEKMAQYLEEERHMREENLRLQRKLQREMERREALCRQLSESDGTDCVLLSSHCLQISSFNKGLSYASHTVGFTPPTSLTRAGMSYYNSPGLHVQHMGASHGITRPSPRRSSSPDKFKRPTPPPSPNTQSPVQPPPPPPPPPMQPSVPSAATPSSQQQQQQQHSERHSYGHITPPPSPPHPNLITTITIQSIQIPIPVSSTHLKDGWMPLAELPSKQIILVRNYIICTNILMESMDNFKVYKTPSWPPSMKAAF